jgi:glycosyltransferase involved in cell wall biosynthesis
MCRRLTARMGIDQFLETFAQLHLSYPLHIIGSGPLLLSLKHRHSSSNVNFHGGVSSDLLSHHLLSSCICFVPALELEGFGLIILEAIDHGAIPIVSSLAGGGATFISSIFPQLIFHMHDPDSLQNSIFFALDNYSLILEQLRQKVQHVYNNSLSTLVTLCR